jgi:3-deoxy-D-manno-octulosonic acid kinase
VDVYGPGPPSDPVVPNARIRWKKPAGFVRLYKTMPVEKTLGNFTIIYYSFVLESAAFLRVLADAPLVSGKGRSGIKMLEAEGQRLVARKYTHGGLFRKFTGDLFFARQRATAEAEILSYLRNTGFPVVMPFCVVIEERGLAKRLHLVTVFEDGAVDLLGYLRSASRRQRLRIAMRLAAALWRLERAGVFHPDLHLNNVLVTAEEKLLFLDFDRARRKAISRHDTESMFRRLGRFVDKMERQRRFSATRLEKALFLRTYARLSGVDLAKSLADSATRVALRHRIGWFIESLLYRQK